MQPSEVERFCQHLRTRHYSRHSINSYALDLQLFFAEINKPVSRITWRDVDRFGCRDVERHLRRNRRNLDQRPLGVRMRQ